MALVRQSPVGGSCEHGNETSTEDREILDPFGYYEVTLKIEDKSLVLTGWFHLGLFVLSLCRVSFIQRLVHTHKHCQQTMFVNSLATVFADSRQTLFPIQTSH
jgi:hypothetical protein